MSTFQLCVIGALIGLLSLVVRRVFFPSETMEDRIRRSQWEARKKKRDSHSEAV